MKSPGTMTTTTQEVSSMKRPSRRSLSHAFTALALLGLAVLIPFINGGDATASVFLFLLATAAVI